VFSDAKSDEDESGTPQFDGSRVTESNLFDHMAFIRLTRALSKYADDPEMLEEWITEFEQQAVNLKKISNSEWIDYIVDLLFTVSQNSPNLTEICQTLYRVYNNARKKD